MSIGAGALGVLGLVTQGIGSGIQTGAAYQDAEAQNRAAEWNANILTKQAGNYRHAAGIERALGKKEAEDVRRDARKMIGSQRAMTGASGAKVDVGSSVDLQEDTARWSEYDAQTAIYNRDTAAFKLENEADTADMQAKMTRATKRNPALAAGAVGLTGVSNLLQTYGGW